ncbi:MAG: hypothetical protein MJE68_31535 [Proteobacteria bacterium]|nr:hypothetical protein [Pseudomonadota bacterium]
MERQGEGEREREGEERERETESHYVESCLLLLCQLRCVVGQVVLSPAMVICPSEIVMSVLVMVIHERHQLQPWLIPL